MKILNILLWPFLLPIFLFVYLFWPKARPYFSERLGLGGVRLIERGYLLFHVASLGEARAASRLIEALSQRVPLLLSTMTVTGREALEKAHPSIPVSLAPIDLPGLWTPFFRSRRIRGILLFETEIWPSMLTSAKDLGLSYGIVNGRLSSRSYGRYKRLRFFIRPFLRGMSLVTVQSKRDEERFKGLGVLGDRLKITGNLKWDVEVAALSPDRAKGIFDWLGEGGEKRANGGPLRLLGSSVHPGEVRELLRVSRAFREKGRPISLILAPRHLDVLPGLLSDLPPSVKISLRSREGGLPDAGSRNLPGRSGDILYILDTYGELGAVTGLADCVFVGGTLVPVGGHSPVEAAFHGKPVLWGPYRDHIADIAEGFMEAGAAIEVENGRDLETALTLLWDDRDRREDMGARARRLFESNGGPLERTLDALSPFLETLFPERV